MIVRVFMEGRHATRIDLHNKIDPKTGVRYLGHAWCDLWTGMWRCMADVNGALCVVEIESVTVEEA